MSNTRLAEQMPALPITTAPRDGTWFRALGPGGLRCKARFITVVGPSGVAMHALFSEFGAMIEATSWLPLFG